MAHQQQRDFLQRVKDDRPEWFQNVSVLEVGSLNINGTVRDFFHRCSYLGVDVAHGPGVDLVAEGQNLDHPDNHFDVAISAECFEHNPYWAETFANMHRMARVVIFTCASEGRPEHGTHTAHPDSSPLTLDWNYYRNLTAFDFLERFFIGEMFSDFAFENNEASHDLYFWGIKRAS
jgi:hypothetical protein